VPENLTMAGLRFSEDDIKDLERGGARVRSREDGPRAMQPAAQPPVPPAVNVQNAVTMDVEPLADAMRDTASQFAGVLQTAVLAALSQAAPHSKGSAPVTGFDVQVVSRDMDGAISRMKITITRA